jgi:ribosomal protein L4
MVLIFILGGGMERGRRMGDIAWAAWRGGRRVFYPTHTPLKMFVSMLNVKF